MLPWHASSLRLFKHLSNVFLFPKVSVFSLLPFPSSFSLLHTFHSQKKNLTKKNSPTFCRSIYGNMKWQKRTKNLERIMPSRPDSFYTRLMTKCQGRFLLFPGEKYSCRGELRLRFLPFTKKETSLLLLPFQGCMNLWGVVLTFLYGRSYRHIIFFSNERGKFNHWRCNLRFEVDFLRLTFSWNFLFCRNRSALCYQLKAKEFSELFRIFRSVSINWALDAWIPLHILNQNKFSYGREGSTRLGNFAYL